MREIAGAFRRPNLFETRLVFFFCCGQGRCDLVKPRDDPFDIAVDDDGAPVKGDGGDGRDEW